jgi:hypothetical protein
MQLWKRSLFPRRVLNNPEAKLHCNQKPLVSTACRFAFRNEKSLAIPCDGYQLGDKTTYDPEPPWTPGFTICR